MTANHINQKFEAADFVGAEDYAVEVIESLQAALDSLVTALTQAEDHAEEQDGDDEYRFLVSDDGDKGRWFRITLMFGRDTRI